MRFLSFKLIFLRSGVTGGSSLSSDTLLCKPQDLVQKTFNFSTIQNGYFHVVPQTAWTRSNMFQSCCREIHLPEKQLCSHCDNFLVITEDQTSFVHQTSKDSFNIVASSFRQGKKIRYYFSGHNDIGLGGSQCEVGLYNILNTSFSWNLSFGSHLLFLEQLLCFWEHKLNTYLFILKTQAAGDSVDKEVIPEARIHVLVLKQVH